MSDPVTSAPRPRPPLLSRYELVLMGVLAALAVVAALVGSDWWLPLTFGVVGVVVGSGAHRLLDRRATARRTRERGTRSTPDR